MVTMKFFALPSILFILLLLLLGSTAASAESPREGLQAIIDLHEAEEFSTLIRERYSELDKAISAAKVDALIERYTQRASGERLQDVIAQYTRFLEEPPQIVINPMPRSTETNSMAIFTLGNDKTLRLYKQKNGKWGFHL